MSEITNEYSNFPSQLIQKHNFKDVDNSVAEIIKEIKDLQAQENFKEATEKINLHKEILKNYIIDASFINTLVEEIRNTQIYALRQCQNVFVCENIPSFYNNEDIWIGV